VGTTVAQVAQAPTTVDLLKALGGLAIPATTVIVFLIILVLVAAVIFGGFEFDGGYGKFTLKLGKAKHKAVDTDPHVDDGQIAIQDSIMASPPAQDVEAQATPPDPEEETTSDDNGGWAAYWNATSVHALDEAYPSFLAILSPGADEFWETQHRKRRAELGADNGMDGVRQLLAEQPTWVYPYAVLIDWAVRDHDLVAAHRYLDEGLQRQNSPQFGFLLSAGVRLKFITEDAAAALRLCVEYSKATIPERMKATAFFTLADLLKDAGSAEGYRVALEWAIAIQPYDRDKTFSLAYSYSEISSHWPLAMWHYQKVISQENDGPVARNNLGILLGHFDKESQIDAYEKAAAAGDVYAPANLANLLIADGYIAAAERMLKSVDEPGAAAELHSRATSAAMAARRALEEREAEIRRDVATASKEYRASIARSLRRLQSHPELPTGFFGSADNLVAANIGPDGAQMRVRLGRSDYVGLLSPQATCFGGTLHANGATILGTYSIYVTLLAEGDGNLRLFQWPGAIGSSYQMNNYELLKIEGAPPAPPPALPAPPPANNVLAGLLELKPRSEA